MSPDAFSTAVRLSQPRRKSSIASQGRDPNIQRIGFLYQAKIYKFAHLCQSEKNGLVSSLEHRCIQQIVVDG